MRVSTNQLYDRSIQGILDNQYELSKTQQQLSTGKKILTPSDDPVGASQVIRLTEELDIIEQYQKNNTLLTSSLEQQETVLSNITDSLNRARQLTLQAGNGVNTSADRNAIGLELKQIRDEVFDLMNSRNANGDYIFAGYQSHSPAFEYDAGASGNKYQFTGDDGFTEIQLSKTVRIKSNDSGKEVFENVFARRTASMTSSTAASASIDIASQSSFDRFHKQHYDAVTPANNQYQITINATGDQATLTNVGSGATLATEPFTSGNPITFNGLSFTIDASGGETVDFSLDTPEKKNIAETLNDLFNVLSDETTTSAQLDDAIADALTGIDNGMTRIADAISAVGGRLNVAETVLETHLDQKIIHEQARSNIQDVDYAEAISELSKQETALQAAQQTFGRVTNLSLFDYI